MVTLRVEDSRPRQSATRFAVFGLAVVLVVSTLAFFLARSVTTQIRDAVNVLASHAGATVRVVDMSVTVDTPPVVSAHKVRRGSGAMPASKPCRLIRGRRPRSGRGSGCGEHATGRRCARVTMPFRL